MILNLSIDYSDVEAIARRYGLDPDKELIIDCSATMKLAKPNFFSVCEIQDFEEINNRSAREYIQEIGKISVAPGIKKNSSVRKVKVLEHTIFWITLLAIKRTDNTLGKTVYLLDRILPIIRHRINNEKVFVSLPKGNEQFSHIIKRILNKHGIENFYIIKKRPSLILFTFLNNFIWLFIFYMRCLLLFRFSAKIKTEVINQNYFISHSNKIFDKDYEDLFLSDTKHFSDSLINGIYWPIFKQFNILKRSRSFLSTGYGKALPGFLQLSRLFIDSFWQVLTFKWRKDKNHHNVFFSDKLLLEYEIKNAITANIHYLFYGIWLKNYFSRLTHKVNVIYQDEFYEDGRIISRALESYDHVTTIGLQHGLFDLHHTVYGISELEFNKETGDPLPSPKLFVVWGEFFKNYFLSNNHFDQKRIKVLGNLRYLNMEVPSIKRKIKKVLWCTSTPELAKNEILLLGNAILDNDEYEVTLREHPIYKYTDELENTLRIFERFPKLKVSTRSLILDEIRYHDLIIVNCFTTVFLDASLNGKYCLRLFPYQSYASYLKEYKSQLVFNIFSESDVYFVLDKINTSKINIDIQNEAKEIVNIHIPKWKQLLVNGFMNVA